MSTSTRQSDVDAGPPRAFGALLRQYRIASGLTQEALAERAGLSVRGLSDLERGARHLPYRDTVHRLTAALGLTPEQTERLLKAVRRVGVAPAMPDREAKYVLPRRLTSFVGRNQELVEVESLLEQTRLLTLTGPGGIGKTRLAVEVADSVGHKYKDGVVLAEFAGVSDPPLVLQVVASALDVQEQPARPLRETVIDALRSKHLLLVFDNCEHVIQACAELAEMLLTVSIELHILATSRESLRIGGEISWRVPPLELPRLSPPLAFHEISKTGSGALFIDRVRAALPGFQVNDGNVADIAHICQRLDGIPLALELAAARVPMLGIADLSERLDDCFRVLTAGSRTGLPRQQTLRSTLDWSCGLLTERERRTFARVSVFAGGWTLSAAERVVGDEAIHASDVADLMAQLVDKSLVLAEERNGPQRYRLLEPVRQYARELLVASGEDETIRRQHAEYFTDLAEVAEPEFLGSSQLQWIRRLEREHDNLRAALAWSVRRAHVPGGDERPVLGLRLAAALVTLWHVRGHWREGRRWLNEALAMATSAPVLLRVKALNAAGWLAWDQGDYQRADALSVEALGLSRGSGDAWSIAWSAGRLSHVRWKQARYAEAAALATEAHELFRRLEMPWFMGWALHQLGRVAHAQGDDVRASDLFEESLVQFRASGDRGFGTAFQFANLGDVALRRGDCERAISLYEQALAGFRELGFQQGLVHTLQSLAEACGMTGAAARSHELHREALLLCRDLGDTPGLARSLEGVAALAQFAGHFQDATRLFAAAEVVRSDVDTGYPVASAEACDRNVRLSGLRSQLGEAEFDASWRAGTMMSMADAVSYAVADRELA
jgi:predicted ATPase/DNA-binding XRE family transcriptional regulator